MSDLKSSKGVKLITDENHSLENRVIQTELKTRLDVLMMQFSEHIMGRAGSLMKGALEILPGFGTVEESLAWKLAANETHYTDNQETFMSEAEYYLDGIRGLKPDIIGEMLYALTQGQFRDQKSMTKVIMRPLKFDDHISNYSDLLGAQDADIQRKYDVNALLAAQKNLDLIKSPEWISPNFREKAYEDAESGVTKDYHDKHNMRVDGLVRDSYHKLFYEQKVPDHLSGDAEHIMEAWDEVNKWYEAEKAKGSKTRVGSAQVDVSSLEKDMISPMAQSELTLENKLMASTEFEEAFNYSIDNAALSLKYVKFRDIMQEQELQRYRRTIINEGKGIIKNSDEIKSLVKTLERGHTEILPEDISDTLAKFYGQEERAVLKFGVDPTGSDMHLGHSVSMHLMRRLQDAGYYVTLLIGDWTAQIGDPSGRTTARQQLTREEVAKNAEHYFEQASKILDPSTTNVVYNSMWFQPMGAQDQNYLMDSQLVASLMARQDFRGREGVTYGELKYIMYQAFDTFFLGADFEFGAKDQRLNLLKGREIQRDRGTSQQAVVMSEQLPGPGGIDQMSKTGGNAIFLNDAPSDMYTAIMSVTDHAVLQYFRLLTDVSDEYLDELAGSLGLDLMLTRLEKTASKAAETENRDYSNVYSSGFIRGTIDDDKVNGAKNLIPILKDIDARISAENPAVEYTITLKKTPDSRTKYDADVLVYDASGAKALENIIGRKGVDSERGASAIEGSPYHPKTAKENLAHKIVESLYDAEKADAAREHWDKVVSKRTLSGEVREYVLPNAGDIKEGATYPLVEAIHSYTHDKDIDLSKTAIRGLINGGAVKTYDSDNMRWVTVKNLNHELPPSETVIRFGKGKEFKLLY